MSNCSDCKNNGTQICSVCCSYQGYPDRWEAKPKTNADRIRAMSDEELADWLCHIVSNETVNCSHCIAEEHCKAGRNGFKEWLKQEAET